MLIIKQIRGTWTCKNFGLATQMQKVEQLMGNFKAIELHHVARVGNHEADALAGKKLNEFMIGAISFPKPRFNGNQHLQDVIRFLETGECPQEMEKGQKKWLAKKAAKYTLINEQLYCKGKDLVLRRVATLDEIQNIISSCHEGIWWPFYHLCS